MAESASAKIQQEASSVIVVETKEEREQACIYKVPDPLRKLNEEVYSPQAISIGPIHHRNEKLEKMEKYKEGYLEAFIERAGIDIEHLKRILKDFEKGVRQCYEETFTDLNSEDFVTMILTDASFIIEFFLRNRFMQWTSEDRKELVPSLALRMQLDFILLENQLPFFIIKRLYDLVGFPSRSGYPSFVALTFEYFDSYNKQNMPSNPELRILHFTDLLRNFYLPPPYRLPNRKLKTVDKHIMYSATQLNGVGLKFEVDTSSNCLLDLELDYRKKVFKIPRLTLDNDTQLYVQNLLVLEQCHYPNKTYVTDYFVLLGFIIKTEKDLDLLFRRGIVAGEFDNRHTINFINNLCTSIIYSTMSSKYYNLCVDLNKFYNDPLNGWMVSLKKDYFGSPWKTASTLAAIFLLVLTLIQTVCALLSL